MITDKDKQDFITNPMALMMTLAVDSALESHSKILELINDFEKRGIDVIPISELKKVIAEGTKKEFRGRRFNVKNVKRFF